jgi:hypothetical protein
MSLEAVPRLESTEGEAVSDLIRCLGGMQEFVQ